MRGMLARSAQRHIMTCPQSRRSARTAGTSAASTRRRRIAARAQQLGERAYQVCDLGHCALAPRRFHHFRRRRRDLRARHSDGQRRPRGAGAQTKRAQHRQREIRFRSHGGGTPPSVSQRPGVHAPRPPGPWRWPRQQWCGCLPGSVRSAPRRPHSPCRRPRHRRPIERPAGRARREAGASTGAVARSSDPKRG